MTDLALAAPLRIAVRVDATPRIGFGHAVRCATLCSALRARGHTVVVLTREMSDLPRRRFEADGIAVVELGANSVTDAIDDIDPALVLIDGYHLGDEVLALSDAGLALMLIDDNAELPVERAVLVLNQNPHAHLVPYPPADDRYLLGPAYALIRSDVVALAHNGTHPVPMRVLVALGGTDPARLTLPIVHSLLSAGSVVPVVAFGDSHPDSGEMSTLCAAGAVLRAPADLLDAFDSAQLAIAGAGSMMWELALLGIPTVAVIVADNQAQSTAAVAQQGAVIAVDARADVGVEPIVDAAVSLLASADRMRELSDAGRVLIDGDGPGRVVRAIEACARRRAPTN